MPKLKLSVNVKLLMFTVLIVGITSSISAYFPYTSQRQALEDGLAAELLSIVLTAAVVIDGDLHENIYLDVETGIGGKDEFDAIQVMLANISDSNKLRRASGLSPIYTLRQSSSMAESLEFVVMTNRNESGDFFVGALLNMEGFHSRVLQGEPQTTGVYEDSEGLWITAAAPIRDSKGRVVGIVQADRPIDFFRLQLAILRNEFLFGAVFGVLLGCVLASVFSRNFTNPIKVLLKATRSFSSGLYEDRIQIQRGDEFGELYQSFDDMTNNLSEAVSELNRSNVELAVRAEEMEAMALFAKLNPGPVFRVGRGGDISHYNQPASTLFCKNGASLSSKNIAQLFECVTGDYLTNLIDGRQREQVIIQLDGVWFQFVLCGSPEFGFANVYGADISDTINAQERAEAASLAKSRFLATMSHELRTPMNAIIGFTQLVQRSSPDPLLKSSLHKIFIASNTLLDLINNILDFSKIEERQVELDRTHFMLTDVLHEVSVLFEQQSVDSRVGLYVGSLGLFPDAVCCDRLRLKQVLVNLVGNAIKFSENGVVILGVSWNKGEGYLFEVLDDGIGLSQVQIESLFDPFTQADVSTTRKYGGTGLGLSISQGLIERMGGVIQVESELGQGSRFFFHLQGISGGEQELVSSAESSLCVDVYCNNEILKRYYKGALSASFKQLNTPALNQPVGSNTDTVVIDVHVAASENDYNSLKLNIALAKQCKVDIIYLLPEELDSNPLGLVRGVDRILFKPVSSNELVKAVESGAGAVDESLQSKLSEQATTSALTGVSTRKASTYEHLRGARVLIVEDNPVNQDLDIHLMKEVGANYLLAANGQEALDLLADNEFDLILMDKQMPVMDGCVAAQKIRQESKWQHIPIIAITANALSGDLDECINAGMNDYVSKPIDALLLYSKMEKWLSNCVLDPNKWSGGSGNVSVAIPVGAVSSSISIEGFDCQSAINRLNGLEGIYITTLQAFVEYHKEEVKGLRTALIDSDESEPHRVAHTVKGLASTIGAIELLNIAVSIESELERSCVLSSDLLIKYEQVFECALGAVSEFLAGIGCPSEG